MTSEALRYDILARDELSSALAKIAAVASKVDRQLMQVGKAAAEMATRETEAEAKTRALGEEMEQTGRRSSVAMAKLRAAGEAAKGVSSHFEGLGGKLRTVGAGMAGLAAVGGAAGAAGLAALGAVGLKAASGIEQATITFTTLLKSGTKAKTFMQDLQKFAAATPFELPGLQKSASQMLAAGFAAKDVIPMLTRLGNATSAMGTGSEGIDRATYALNQMRAAGRVTAEDMNQLTDAGILGWDALAAQMHKSQGEVRKLVSEGKIQPNTLFDAILNGKGRMGEFNGMMEQQSQTLSGLWSSFKDNASQALAGAVQPAIPLLKQVIGFFSEQIPAGISKVLEWGGKLKGWWRSSGIAEELGNVWSKLSGQGAENARKAFDDVVKTFRENKDQIKEFIELLSSGLMWVATNAVPLFLRGLQAIETGIGAIMRAYDFLRGVAINTFGGILEAAAASMGWIPGLGPKLVKARDDFREFATKVNDELDRIKNKDVTVHAHFVTSGYSGGVAAAFGPGPAKKAFASGGPAPGLEVIRAGEHGPEDIILPPGGGYVQTATQTAMGMGGTYAPVYNISVNVPTGSAAGQQVISAIKAYERSNGTGWRDRR